MKKLFTSKYISIALIAVLAIAIFASSSGIAFAQAAPAPTQAPNPYSCGITTLGTCLPYFIFEITSPIFSLLISIGAWIIQVGLQLSTNVYNSPAIQSGFAVCLSLANLGFVLAIIVIAIATILHSESYGYKKTLWRLIVMAVLINFGLVITAPIVNLANGMTTYFMNSINGGSAGVTLFVNQLAQQTAPAAADQPPTTAGAGQAPTTNCPTAVQLSSESQGMVSIADLQATCANENKGTPSTATVFTQSILALLFGIIFKFIIALAFFSIGALLFVRYIWLAVLLILLPFAWLSWVFPGLGGEFSKWWSNFIKWTFFAPAAMFFIYLAMIINSKGYFATVGSTGIPAGQGSTGPAAAVAIAIGNSSFLNQFMNDIVILGIMIGGLIAASSMTGKAGNFVVAQAKNVSGAVQGYVGKKTRSGAKTASRYATDRLRGSGKQYNPLTHETTTRLQRIGSTLQNVPGLRGAGAAIARGNSPDTIKKNREEDIQKYIDHELKALTGEGVLARANSRAALADPVVAAALAQELARRNLTGGVSASRMEGLVAAADRLGNLEKVTANRPDLMPQRRDRGGAIIETREEATARAIRSAKGEIIQTDADTFDRAHPRAGMTQAEVERAVLALSPAQLAALGSDTTAPRSQERQANLTNAVRDLIASIPGLVRLNATSGKNELDPAVLAAAVAARPELANLSKIVKHMDQSQNWDNVI